MTPAYRIDAEKGIVYGLRGQPIRRRANGYVVVRAHAHIVGMAHRMIWESVHGPIPSGMQINHVNGKKADNRIANLELVTPSENTLHAYRLGLRSARGEANGRARLNEHAVRQLRERVHAGTSRRALARETGIPLTTIRNAVSGARWGHL